MSRGFLALFLIFAACASLKAQGNEVDAALDRYESICRNCIELREMVERGEKVSAGQMSSLLGEMRALRETFSSSPMTMTASQRNRYEDIRDSYAVRFSKDGRSGRLSRPVPDAASLDMPPCTSAEICGTLPQMRPKSAEKWGKTHFGVSALCSLSSVVQYGLSLSFRSGRWGGYVSAMSNFIFQSPSYMCSSSGALEEGGVFWGDGTAKRSAFTFSAGPSYRVCRFMDVMAGLGYNDRRLFWRDINGEWAGVTDLTSGSPYAEAGVSFVVRGLRFSMGAAYAFKPSVFSLQLGLGYEF